jgi:hypothetical protein
MPVDGQPGRGLRHGPELHGGWSRSDRSEEADVPGARKALTALPLLTGLVVAGCGGEESGSGAATATATDTPTSSTSPPTSEPAPSSTPPPANDTVVTTGDSEFGAMLFDDRGQAI